MSATEKDNDQVSFSTASLGKGDLLSLEHIDPVLNAKMHLVNDVRVYDQLSSLLTFLGHR